MTRCNTITGRNTYLSFEHAVIKLVSHIEVFAVDARLKSTTVGGQGNPLYTYPYHVCARTDDAVQSTAHACRSILTIIHDDLWLT
jgi:hypothetical protein